VSDEVGGKGGAGAVRRILVALAAGALALSVALWIGGRVTAAERALAVHGSVASAPDTASSVTVLAWNVAHGRGAAPEGVFRNWRGGSTEERARRLEGIAGVIRRSGADVVVLNEVDFRASWSGGVNQARRLARLAGYPVRVEQRSFDLHLPLLRLAFGNALLSRHPVVAARRLEIPARSRVQALAVGAKSASVVRVRTPLGPVSVVPIHLHPRDGATRRAAVPVFEALAAAEEAPTVLAGDFNADPPGWTPDSGPTVVGELLAAGWRSPRAAGPPGAEATFPLPAPVRAIDWILVEPPLEVVEARVVRDAGSLSDHAPVVAVIRHGGDP